MLLKLVILLVALTALKINQVKADAMVVGSVFCDRCKDGQLSLFDYPINGIKVTVMCMDNDGQVTMSEEARTNWLGGYAMWVRGDMDLSGCYAHVEPTYPTAGPCTTAAGPAQPLSLVWSLFNGGMYRVGCLLTQPANPMENCPRTENPSMPFSCTSRNWKKAENKCYWRVVSPESKVAWVFGVLAAERYGLAMSLWEGLHRGGDSYSWLLREATTALLNSYTSHSFPMSSVGVVWQMNLALMGSRMDALRSASRFKRVNDGPAASSCNFTPCS